MAPVMNDFYLNLAGESRGRTPVVAANLEDARNAAVRFLGQYLSDHPTFADEGHWRLNVEDEAGTVLTTVVVATVTPRRHEVAALPS